MLRGIYTSATAMIAEFARQEMIAKNLANTNSSGYKKGCAFLRSFKEILVSLSGSASQAIPVQLVVSRPKQLSQLGAGVLVDEVKTDFSQGEIKQTGGKLDLAIDGDGFFVVQDGENTFYTRNGNFNCDKEGYLVTSQGRRVMGRNGEILIANSDPFVDANGDVYVNSEIVDRIKVVDFDDRQQLNDTGSGFFTRDASSVEARELESVQVRQGYLEAANVNVVEAMVQMTSLVRSYQASNRILQSQDETLKKAINEVGRVG